MPDKKTETGSQYSEAKPVADLLTSILNEVQKQVQIKTPEPLGNGAIEAVTLFREIGARLALLPAISLPAIRLTANPTKIDAPGPVTLNWTSSEAQRISIDNGVGEVSPPESGSLKVIVSRSTTFTATATSRGPCGATAAVDVIVAGVVE